MVETTTITDLLKQYEDCFGEMGKLPYTYHITADPTIKPIKASWAWLIQSGEAENFLFNPNYSKPVPIGQSI